MPAPGEITITESIKEAKLSESEDILEDGADSPKPEHKATSRQREQTESEIVSEAQIDEIFGKIEDVLTRTD